MYSQRGEKYTHTNSATNPRVKMCLAPADY